MPKGNGRNPFFNDPEGRKRYEEALAKWREIMRPLIEEVERSERLTAEDFAVTIGPCPPISEKPRRS